MYKLTQPSGLDFYSGTINYRDAIGSTVRVTDFDPVEQGVCGKGVHAFRNPIDCFVGANIPCAVFRVEGIGKIAGDKYKSRYRALKVIEEITSLDDLFGWEYTEAINPVYPFRIHPPEITDLHKRLCREWASILDISVGNSVWANVRASLGANMGNSVRDCVGANVWDSVGNSVWASVRNGMRGNVGHSVRNSVGNSVWAYIGSLFPGITNWKHISSASGYPYQCCVDLWRLGLVPVYYRKKWHLYGGKKPRVLFTAHKEK